jgi:hypothetical protein
LDYNLSGDAILVISGNSQAKIIDRDGNNVLECVKGDQYIVDMAKTKVMKNLLLFSSENSPIIKLFQGPCWHVERRKLASENKARIHDVID